MRRDVAYIFDGYDPADGLTYGRWVPRGGVLVWQPHRVAEDLSPPPAIHDLLACPTCRSTVTDWCRTKDGDARPPHVARLAPRLCSCGHLPLANQPWCVSCARTQAGAA